MAEAAKDLECFLLSLEQGGRIGSDSVKGIRPLGARGALRVQPEGRRVEQDSLARDLFDHGPLGEDLLEGLPAGQPSVIELQTPQLCQRVVVVLQCGFDSVLRAQVAHEDGDDQRVCLVAGHLDEARRGRISDVLVL